MPKNVKELLEMLAWVVLFVGAAVLYCRHAPDQLSGEADLTAEAETEAPQ